MLVALAWVATAAILATYVWMVRSPQAVQKFHWANVLGCVPLAILNYQTGNLPNLAVNVAFGGIAATAVLRKILRGSHNTEEDQ